MLTLSRENQFHKTGNKTICINTSGELVQTIGHLGGVVLRYQTLRSSPCVLTLYDFLCDLCVETGLNLLTYQTIKLYSELRSYTLVLKFVECDGAKKFFAKMYLDALQGGVK